MSNQDSQPNKDSLKNSVLDRLQDEQVVPKAKAWFICQECLVWVLWGLSVLFGAISVAVMGMVWTMRHQDVHEATHESAWSFFISILPYIWMVVLIAMVTLAYYNLRQTKRGYRYPFSHIVVSSIVFSIIGGVILNAAGVGMMVDREMGKHMPMYMSQEKMERKLWQVPEEGRLVGVVSGGADSAYFLTGGEAVWRLGIKELRTPDRARLVAGEPVRVLGLPATTSDYFYACGVYPWLFGEKKMKTAEMAKERQDFVDRMYEHKDERDRLRALNEEAAKDRNMGHCADIEIVRRIGESMQ